MPAAARLFLSALDWRAICAHLTRELPNEACGLLAGREGRVRVVYPIRNALASRVAFRMDPAEQLAAFQALEAAGWELTGIYHSHPAGPAEPSVTDLAQAYYPEALYLIGVPSGTAAGWSARVFQLDGGRSREVPVEIGP